MNYLYSFDKGITGNIYKEFSDLMKLRMLEIKIQEAQVFVKMQAKK